MSSASGITQAAVQCCSPIESPIPDVKASFHPLVIIYHFTLLRENIYCYCEYIEG